MDSGLRLLNVRMGRLPGLAWVALALLACGRNESPPPSQQGVVEAAPVVPAPFTPPSTGLLNEDQIRRFLEAHQAMARINDLYLDSLASAPPERKRSVYQALDIARDKVTRHYGLNGYEEYRWILEDAPRHPANVRILERMQVTTVTP